MSQAPTAIFLLTLSASFAQTAPPAGHRRSMPIARSCQMPYGAQGVAAVHYAVHPDSGFFQLSDPGALSVSGSGLLTLTTGGGKVRQLIVDVDKKPQAIAAFVGTASAKPIEPHQRSRRADVKAQDTVGAAKEPAPKTPRPTPGEPVKTPAPVCFAFTAAG